LHLSGRRGISSGRSSDSNIGTDDENFPSGHPSVSRSFKQFKGCIRSDVMANRPNALQSSRRSQCSSESVWTTWLYYPDAIQCLTSIRVFASRHSYGKTVATVRTMCDPIQTMSTIRQVVHTKFNLPEISLQGSDAQSLIIEIACIRSGTIRMLGQYRPDTIRYFGHNCLLKYRIGTKLVLFES